MIILSDAGADPDYYFEDFTNLMEKVRVDFGCKIEFREEYPIRDMIPNQEVTDFADKLFTAKRGFAIADIDYSSVGIKPNQNTKGLLIYIKSTLIDGLPPDLYGYQLNNPDYPDETTADQFFSEVQFEAYRELGYQLGMKVNWSVLNGYI